MAEIKLTQEQFAKAAACNTAEELIALCKEFGVELTQETAEKFLAQKNDQELTLENIETVSGGDFCIGAVSCACLGIGI